LDGIININKPSGITSYGVIRVVKKIAQEKKIGHLGTLDPMATGVLPLFLGKMTKLIPFFNEGDKGYRVTAMLGGQSTTLDAEGEIEEVPIPEDCTPEKVRETLLSFLGEIEQTPPMYSAVKINGKKLYEYARKGETIERKSRKVTIHEITNIEYSAPILTFDVFCSKGTYIRTLADDVAQKLGTRAYLTALCRTKVGQFFNLENSIDLDRLEKLDEIDLLTSFVQPISIMPDWHVISAETEQMRIRIKQGNAVPVCFEKINFSPQGSDSPRSMVVDQKQRLLAVGNLEFSQDSQCNFHPMKVLF